VPAAAVVASLARRRRRKGHSASSSSSGARGHIALSAKEPYDYDKESFKMPTVEDLEKVVDGVKYVAITTGTLRKWVREDQVGNYRLTDIGYLGRGEDGKWSHMASMPKDLSHLTAEQIERYKKEIRGELNCPATPEEGDEDWKPMAQVPPMEMWPFYEADVTDEAIITEVEEQSYKHMDMTAQPGQAGVLASRWKVVTEERRHLGYSPTDSLEDVTNINSACNALKTLTTELRRFIGHRNRRDDDTLPHDHRRLDALTVTTFLGSDAGSAMAMWTWNKARARINVDLLVGDNVTRSGLVAEEMLLRFLFKKAKELEATKVWCRSKRSESGRVVTPRYFSKYGFERVPEELQQSAAEEMEEFVAIPLVSDYKLVRDEKVRGLRLWLAARELQQHLEGVNKWCAEMGAAEVSEVAENRDDVADFLGDALTEEERERLLSI